ncbi:MAG: hypothetical protein GVY30_05400 [Chloroflexi bacterium]|jgi:hypothetical protein|nr:hypothetical protein [Chloroflexota bacterium]
MKRITTRLQNLPPALVLFIVAPVFGELFSGSSPLNEFINPIIFLTLALLYGCGAILVRELVIRWDKGWPSLLLLGVAYGIYEEGIMVQSFFDPTWVDLGNLAVYGRVAGVNWVWAEHLILFHALISIAASIAFVEMLYPQRRRERWVTPSPEDKPPNYKQHSEESGHDGRGSKIWTYLTTRTWWRLNWIGFIGIYLVWELLTHYEPGIWLRLAAWMTIFASVGLARIAPKRILPPLDRTAPRPWRFWLTGFLGLFGQFFIIYQGADEGAYSFPIAMLLLMLWYLWLGWMISRWSGNGAAWDDRHRIALINGALSLLLALGPLTMGEQYPVMYFSHPVYWLLLWLAGRKIRRRVNNQGTSQ